MQARRFNYVFAINPDVCVCVYVREGIRRLMRGNVMRELCLLTGSSGSSSPGTMLRWIWRSFTIQSKVVGGSQCIWKSAVTVSSVMDTLLNVKTSLCSTNWACMHCTTLGESKIKGGDLARMETLTLGMDILPEAHNSMGASSNTALQTLGT